MTCQRINEQFTRRVALAALTGIACLGIWTSLGLQAAADDVFIGPATRPADAKPARSTSAADLLREIEKKPGYYSQMCGLPTVELTRFSPYAFTRFEERVSADDFTHLRQKRSEVVDLIRSKLISARRAIRDGKRPQPATVYETDEISHDLAILIDLNGVEALDALCDWAAELDIPQPPAATTQAAESSKKLWPGAEVIYGFNSPRIAEALSTITAILRQEGCQPLLNSDIERKYCESVQAVIKPRRVNPEEAKSSPNPFDCWDERCQARTSFRPYCWIELTPQRGNQIIGWAREHLKSTPPAKRKAATGMSPWPIVR